MHSRKELLAVGRAIHTFEYQHLDNPELTDDTPVLTALYNATTATIMTCSVRHVRVWDARTGSLSRVYREPPRRPLEFGIRRRVPLFSSSFFLREKKRAKERESRASLLDRLSPSLSSCVRFSFKKKKPRSAGDG